jgi:hypothetical protein
MRAPFCEAEVRAMEVSDFWRLTNWPEAIELDDGRFSDMLRDESAWIGKERIAGLTQFRKLRM